MTILPTIFANGDHARTLLIYPSKNLPKELSLEDIVNDPEYVITGRSGGWIDKEIFAQYCEMVVIPFFNQQRLTHNTPNARGLYLLDGHSSRWNVDLMRKFNQNNIDVLTLVSHTSHICQPLDAIVFGVFKSILLKELRTQLRAARKRAIDADSLRPFLDLVDRHQLAQEDNTMDAVDDSSAVDTDVSSLDGSEDGETGTKDPLLSTTIRRYILVETAKRALHIALYRDTVRKSFKVCGLSSPPDLQMALKREGIRIGPDMQRAEENMNNKKKRKRRSINGVLLTHQNSMDMMQEEERAKAAKEQAPKAKRRKKASPSKTKQ